MFCKKCGAEIEGNSKFCNVCGCEINAGKKVEGDGKILLVAEPQKKWCMFMAICGAFLLFIGAGFFYSVIGTKVSVFSSSQEVQQRNQGVIMALLMLGFGIICLYEAMKWASMKITVCENAVYGSFGVGMSKQFKHTYDEIMDVSGGSNSTNTIVIVTKAKSYMLVHMEYAKEAARMIYDRIEQQ